MLRIVGFTKSGYADAVTRRLADARTPATLFTAGKVSAIATPAPPSGWRALLQRGAKPCGMAQASILQTAAGAAPVLKAASGAHILSRDDIAYLLPQYEDSLLAAIDEVGGFSQTRICAPWRPAAVIYDIKQDNVLPRALNLPPGPLREAHDRDIAKALDTELARRRGALREDLIKALRAAFDCVYVLRGKSEALFSATIVTKFEDSASIPSILQTIEEEHGVALRAEAPEPATQIGWVEVIDAAPARLRAARKKLDLPKRAARGDIKAAYYDAMKQSAAAGVVQSSSRLAEINEAYAVILAAADLQGAKSPEDEADLEFKGATRLALRLHKTNARPTAAAQTHTAAA